MTKVLPGDGGPVGAHTFGVLAFLDEQLEKFRELFVREARWIVGCAAVILGH